jgi:sugar (pentulose or hexulose) kinase
MRNTYWLGVDIGTGGSRALLLDSSGNEAAAVSVPHRDMAMQQPLWAEQDPGDWADAAFAAIRGSSLPPGSVVTRSEASVCPDKCMAW